MKAFFTLLALSGIFAGWLVQRLNSVRLTAELEAQRRQNAELISLRLEERRLSSRVPPPPDFAALESDAAERGRLRRAATIREESTPPASRSEFTIGDWSSSSTWTDRGRATPRAAVETALWAAAGGDISVLAAMLQLDDGTLAQATALLAQLPSASRVNYANPEALIASFTAKSIPLGEAQLVWLHENGPDTAVAGVLLSGYPEAPDATPPERSPNAPPQLAPRPNTKVTYLSLRRSDGGWRLVVPPVAVEKIARDIAGLPVK